MWRTHEIERMQALNEGGDPRARADPVAHVPGASAFPTPAVCRGRAAARRGLPRSSPGTRSARRRRTAGGGATGPTAWCGRCWTCWVSSRTRIRMRPGWHRRPEPARRRRLRPRFGPRHASHQNGLDVDVYYPRLRPARARADEAGADRSRAGAGSGRPVRRRRARSSCSWATGPACAARGASCRRSRTTTTTCTCASGRRGLARYEPASLDRGPTPGDWGGDGGAAPATDRSCPDFWLPCNQKAGRWHRPGRAVPRASPARTRSARPPRARGPSNATAPAAARSGCPGLKI